MVRKIMIHVALLYDDRKVSDKLKAVFSERKDEFELYSYEGVGKFKQFIREQKPEVVMYDYENENTRLNMALFESLQRMKRKMKFIILSSSREIALNAILKSADGVVSKTDIRNMPSIIKRVLKDEVYVSPVLMRALAEMIRERNEAFMELLDVNLTPDDKDNIRVLANKPEGHSIRNVAHINVDTFKSRNSRLLKKLGMERTKDVVERYGELFGE